MATPDRTGRFEGLTRGDAARRGRNFLMDSAVDGAQDDARLLLLEACKIRRLDLVTSPDNPLSDEEAHAYAAMLARRADGEPASRILGRRPFWTLELAVEPGVLDPRADSEAVVRLAQRASAAPGRIVDLGCGSGALLCALLTEFETAFGVGVDLSPQACRASARNLSRCGLSDRAAVIRGHWAEALKGPFDLIVSNPPYIPENHIATLDREVRDHDPPLALSGGVDGLDAYRTIFASSRMLMARGGTMIVECGRGQARSVEALARAAGLEKRDAETDLGGRERALAFGAEAASP